MLRSAALSILKSRMSIIQKLVFNSIKGQMSQDVISYNFDTGDTQGHFHILDCDSPWLEGCSWIQGAAW